MAVSGQVSQTKAQTKKERRQSNKLMTGITEKYTQRICLCQVRMCFKYSVHKEKDRGPYYIFNHNHTGVWRK
ncbi:MAG: hypothetical protein BroJett015_32360 [Chloroflexota bacterium]|nr:MAG: hypothetical protein BroJett015_32360 [Chloroflexota bacterium]